MQISVNNESHTMTENSHIMALLEQLGYDVTQVAVAVNTEFVPRGQYKNHFIQAGDKVDIVAPIQGG